jgi:hypothetical protein
LNIVRRALIGMGLVKPAAPTVRELEQQLRANGLSKRQARAEVARLKRERHGRPA